MAFTFFMRDQPTLEHAAAQMVPYASGRSRIKVWDAGCWAHHDLSADRNGDNHADIASGRN